MTTAKVTLLASMVLASVLVYADCPDGGRNTTAAEREDYITTSTALKAALPPAPAGWRVLDRNASGAMGAPDSTCRGEVLIPGYYVNYIWTEQEKRAAKASEEKSARIRALNLLTPEEQKQVDDLGRQARTLERQAIAVIRTNPDEAARLRKEEEPFILQVRVVRKAHADRVFPLIMTIDKENVPGVTGVGTEVSVSVSVRKDTWVDSPKAERVQITGVSKASYDRNELRMSLGRDSKGRNIQADIDGSRNEAETIANLLAASNLTTLTAKNN